MGSETEWNIWSESFCLHADGRVLGCPGRKRCAVTMQHHDIWMARLLLGETFTDPTGNGQPDKLKLSNSEGRGARPSRISQLLPWIGTLGRFLSNTLPGMVAAKPPINVKTGLGTCLVGRLVQLPVQCTCLSDKGLLTRSITKVRCGELCHRK